MSLNFYMTTKYHVRDIIYFYFLIRFYFVKRLLTETLFYVLLYRFSFASFNTRRHSSFSSMYNILYLGMKTKLNLFGKDRVNDTVTLG